MIAEEQGKLADYELIDSGDGYRLERFGEYVFARPDPQVLWKKSQPESEWQKADAVFLKAGEGDSPKADLENEKGRWKLNRPVPEKWLMHYKLSSWDSGKISFYAKMTPFKHTGVFPEQAANWDFISEQLQGLDKAKPRVLNLFGYTGIASVLCAGLGCDVTHVDASKPSVTWAKENMLASGLPEDAIRWILDDALKFVRREVRRGAKYDAIILDPPAFGRGSKGEVWKFGEDLPKLFAEIEKLLDAHTFKFLIINAYAVSVSSVMLKNILEDMKNNLGMQKQIDYGELILRERSGRMLSTGLFGRMY